MNKPFALIVLGALIACAWSRTASATDLDGLAWESPSAATLRELPTTPGVRAVRDSAGHLGYLGGTLAGQPVQSWRFTLPADNRLPRLAVRFDAAANAAFSDLHRLLADKYGTPDEFENAARRDALWTLGPSAVLSGQTRHALLSDFTSGRDAHAEVVFFELPTPSADAPRSDVRYTLRRDPHPTPAQLDAYHRITDAMDRAVRFYNEFTVGIVKTDTVFLDPNEETAEGNINGEIHFGPTDISVRTALHEISHTVGIGTTPPYHRLTVDERFVGKHALAQLRAITGEEHLILHADTWHFWPYGLNNPGEDHSIWDYIDHCQMVSAALQDCREVR